MISSTPSLSLSLPLSLSTVRSHFLANSCDVFKRRDGFDFPGNDLAPTGGLVATDYATCCAFCRRTANCTAFTFNARAQRCFTKFSIGTGGLSNSDGVVGFNREYALSPPICLVLNKAHLRGEAHLTVSVFKANVSDLSSGGV